MNIEKLISGVMMEAKAIRANFERRKTYRMSSDIKNPYSVLFKSKNDEIAFLRKNNIPPFSSGINEFIQPSKANYFEYSANYRPFTALEYYMNSQQCNATPILNYVVDGWPLVREML